MGQIMGDSRLPLSDKGDDSLPAAKLELKLDHEMAANAHDKQFFCLVGYQNMAQPWIFFGPLTVKDLPAERCER